MLNINTVQVNQTNNSTKFYDANHHYMMEKAYYKINKSSTNPRCESSTYSKEDIYGESRESSSKFRR
jgi:hypothetical protein